MPEKINFDFSKPEDQEKFEKLQPDEKRDIINQSRVDAVEDEMAIRRATFSMVEYGGHDARAKNTTEAVKIVNEDREKEINEYKKIINDTDFKTVDFSILKKVPKELLEETTIKFIEAERSKEISGKLKELTTVTAHKIVLILIENNKCKNVADNINKISPEYQREIVSKLVVKDSSIISSLIFSTSEYNSDGEPIFDKVFDKEMVYQILDSGGGSTIVYMLDKFIPIFSDENEKLALMLIDAGFSRDISYSLNKFKDINYNKIAQKIIDAGQADAVAYCLDNFKELDKGFIDKIITAGHGNAVINNRDEFSKRFPEFDKEYGATLQEIYDNTPPEKKVVENLKKMIIHNELAQHSPTALLDSIKKSGIDAMVTSGKKQSADSDIKNVKAIDALKNFFEKGIYSKYKLHKTDFATGMGYYDWDYNSLQQQTAGETSCAIKSMVDFFEFLPGDINIENPEFRKTIPEYAEDYIDNLYKKNPARFKKILQIIKQEDWVKKWSSNTPTYVLDEYQKNGRDILDPNIQKSIAINAISNVFFGQNLISSFPPIIIKEGLAKNKKLPTSSLLDSISVLFKIPNKAQTVNLISYDLGIANKIPVNQFVAVVINEDVKEIPKEVLDIIPKNIPIINTNFEVIRMPIEKK